MDKIRDAGKWGADTMSNNYATGPSPETLTMTAGFKSTEHVLPKHALVLPPARIKDEMFPRVIRLDNYQDLNITQALKWAQSPEVRRAWLVLHVMFHVM